MNGRYPVGRESPLAGLSLPVSELGFTGAAVLAACCLAAVSTFVTYTWEAVP
ncbi:hypothetical protein ABTZ03_30900 [Kitasatospora sp. NPDC096077]|uniref:hypothetical protein n=1 Tax=Kitasatospora sp. NPDC096077 TaxID=3155544 RepID=UPI003332CE7A